MELRGSSKGSCPPPRPSAGRPLGSFWCCPRQSQTPTPSVRAQEPQITKAPGLSGRKSRWAPLPGSGPRLHIPSAMGGHCPCQVWGVRGLLHTHGFCREPLSRRPFPGPAPTAPGAHYSRTCRGNYDWWESPLADNQHPFLLLCILLLSYSLCPQPWEVELKK